MLSNFLPHISGKLALTSASAKGGGTAFPHRAICFVLVPTECTSGGHFAEIRTSIVKYALGINLGHWERVRELLNKFCGYS